MRCGVQSMFLINPELHLLIRLVKFAHLALGLEFTDDLLEDLNPDLHVRCLGDGHVEIERRDVKKKVSRSSTTFGFRSAPDPTGRTSLGGITAATPSRSSSASSFFVPAFAALVDNHPTVVVLHTKRSNPPVLDPY